MALMRYIKDCVRMKREYPDMMMRNVLFVNSQPKYLYGRIVDAAIRLYDKARA